MRSARADRWIFGGVFLVKVAAFFFGGEGFLAPGVRFTFLRVSTIMDRKESNGEGAGLKFMRREMKRKIFVYALILYLVHLDTIEGRVGQVQCGNGSQLAARPVFMFHDLTLE